MRPVPRSESWAIAQDRCLRPAIIVRHGCSGDPPFAGRVLPKLKDIMSGALSKRPIPILEGPETLTTSGAPENPATVVHDRL